MMDGTGIELYVHLEKLEDEVEQFNNVSKNFGDYIDMYKRQMDIIRYSKMADELYDMPALIRTYDEFVEEADRLNKFSKALQDIYKEYKTCNDTYTQMGIDLGNQYAITPWTKTNEGKIVIGTSIIVGLLVIAIVAPEVTAAAMSTGTMTSTTAATMIETVTADMAFYSASNAMISAEEACLEACQNGTDPMAAFADSYMWGAKEGMLNGALQGVGEAAIVVRCAKTMTNTAAFLTPYKITGYVNAVNLAVIGGNSAISTALYSDREKSHCRNVSFEESVKYYNGQVLESLEEQMYTDSFVNGVEALKTSKSKMRTNGNKESGIGKIASKEKSVREITSKSEGYKQNQTFLNGEKAIRNTQGSISPTLYKDGSCIDVRSYNIQNESGRARLIKDVTIRSQKMKDNLPEGTKQTIVIDARGRRIANSDLKKLYTKVKCALDSDVEIRFIR